MDAKIDIGRLAQDELTYELRIRGVTTVTTVDSMRRTLRQLRRIENSESFHWPVYPYKFTEDSEALKNKLQELEGLVKSFSGGATSPEYLKISTKLGHAIGRVNRSVPVSEEDSGARSGLLVSFLGLSSTLQTRVKRFTRSSTLNTSIVNATQASAVEETSDSASDELDDSEIGAHARRSESKIKSVPVMQWSLKYSGDNRELSLNAFLERVDELMIARNVSKTQVYSSAFDLFSGKALIWFRAIRKTLSGWDELVVALREEFQPYDYDEQLFDEIRRRTQGPQESISTYIAIMTNLFRRLTIKIPESNRLRIILKNLAPFYQNQLGLSDIRSLEELKTMGRRLEARKAMVEAYVPPPRRNQSMEPDLACMTSSSSLASVATTPRTLAKCWNCDQEGHLAVQCRQPPRRHCYRCGKPGVTVRDCTRCSLNSRRMR